MEDDLEEEEEEDDEDDEDDEEDDDDDADVRKFDSIKIYIYHYQLFDVVPLSRGVLSLPTKRYCNTESSVKYR